MAVHGPMSIDRRPIFAQPASKRLEVLSNFGPGKAGWWEQSRADWTCPPTSECPLGGHIRGPIAPLSGLSRGWARTFGGALSLPNRPIRGPFEVPEVPSEGPWADYSAAESAAGGASRGRLAGPRSGQFHDDTLFSVFLLEPYQHRYGVPIG